MDRKYRVQTILTVRFSDTDAMGHVNNANIFTYMEQGRVAYFNKLFPEKKLSDHYDIFPFILANIKADFKSPAYCGESLIVGLGVVHMGNKSLTMEYDIAEELTERLVATGSSVLVMYDYASAATYPIPDELKARITELEHSQR
ncbi:MAG TPA: thioesterase family protein [bacterium]|nr:thioesterase family protein [bacterium]